MAKIGVKLGIDGEAEYRKSLNNIIQSAKTLDKQMEELQSSFDENTSSMEKNEKETELLQKKAELLTQEVEKMQTMVDAAAEKFGENSTECQKWEQSLAQAQTELNNTNSEIQAHQEAADEANSALGQLTAEIESQTAELDSLREQYINAVLEFGSTSDEAENLAGRITDLNSELNANQSALDNATSAANGLTGELGEIGESAEGAGTAFLEGTVGQFVPGFDVIKGAIVGAGVTDLIGGIADTAVELGKKVWDLAIEWEESMGNMAVATGLTGDELTALHGKAEEMYLAFNGAGTGLDEFSAITSMLYTRLGMGEEQCESFVNAIAQYSDVFGVDGVEATNAVVDIMKQYNLVTGDATKDTETAIQVFESLSQAQADADVSVSDLSNKLVNQAAAFQALDMDYQEAIGMMDAYRDAGGNVSDISMALQNVVKNLSGETDDLGGAWDEIIGVLGGSEDTFTKLSTEISGTGKTIEDIFGARKAQQMINTFANGKVDVDRFTNSIKGSKGRLDEFFQATRTTEDYIDTGFKGMVTSGMTFDTSLSGVFSNITTAFDNLGKISGNTAKTTNTNMDSTGSAAGRMWNSIKNAFNSITQGSDGMVSALSGDLWGLENLFGGTTLKLNVEAPTISYTKTGSGSNTTLTPSAHYNRFAEAYDHAIRLTAPTIFGAMNGELLVGGDRPGAEIVVGEDHLLDMFEAAMNRADGGVGDTAIYITNHIDGAENPEQFASRLVRQIKTEMRMA